MKAMKMGLSTIRVRLDDTIKKQFDSLSAEFGMFASQCLTFMRGWLSDKEKSYLSLLLRMPLFMGNRIQRF